MNSPFRVVSADFDPDPNSGEATISFKLSKESTEEWRRLVSYLDDGDSLERAIELLLERCRENM